MTRLNVDAIVVSDEAGFACSKSKLVEEGLPHLRPFNIAEDGGLSLAQVYLVPPNEAPKGKAQLLAGDILFNNTNSADLVGKSAVVNEPMVAGFSNHLTRVRVDKKRVDPLWFGFWLRRLRTTGYFTANATQWVSQAAYRTADLRRLELELPLLDEQRRIVDLLCRAEGIVRLRREAQAKAAEIISALFLDMFGDPATNTEEWPVARLGDIAEVVSGITKGRKLNGKPTTPVPYLRVANVQAGFLDLAEIKDIEATSAEIEALTLRPGDIVLTEGGDFDKLGRGAQWRGEVFPCIHQNHVFRVRPCPQAAEPDYFETYLQTQAAKNYFLSVAKRTTNLASINMTQLRNLPVPLPPIDAQRVFSDRVSVLRSIELQQRAATSKAESAFSAMLSRVFHEGAERAAVTESERMAVA